MSSSLHVARQRYLTSMATSAHLEQTEHSPRVIERRRSKVSFCSGTSSRIDPENMQSVGVATSIEAKNKASCLEHGSMVPSRQDHNTMLKRRLTLIRYPPAPDVSRGKRTKDSASNTSFTEKEAMDHLARGSTETMQKLLTPDQHRNGSAAAAAAESPSSRIQKRKTLSEAQTASSMQFTTLGPTTATAPQRKMSRWSRKKSLEAAEMAFRAQTRPKSYNYNIPSSATGGGVADRLNTSNATADGSAVSKRRSAAPTFDVNTFPAKRHYDMYATPRQQSVNPPWATGY